MLSSRLPVSERARRVGGGDFSRKQRARPYPAAAMWCSHCNRGVEAAVMEDEGMTVCTRCGSVLDEQRVLTGAAAAAADELPPGGQGGEDVLFVYRGQPTARLRGPRDRDLEGDSGDLLLCANTGDVERVRQLLEVGVDVNTTSDDGFTALLVAVRDFDEDGWTRRGMDGPIRSDYLGVVALLLEKGAFVNARYKDGDTPLLVAVQEGRFDLVKLLLEKGADANAVNKKGNTPLLVAVRDNRLDLVELLVAKGADVHAEDKGGDTALIRAVQVGVLAIVKLLVEKGANVNVVDKNG
ncbi:MAG: ankyrin repeat domain-containing protein, partial [Planctomycetota bacterium]|nr:ankyrin repeat domain-containing protein [Planctomycetota bacterium]